MPRPKRQKQTSPPPTPPVRLEVVALVTTAVAIPAYAFSSGYFQYLGYPTIRAANLADLASLALTILPVLFVFIAPTIILFLHYTQRIATKSQLRRLCAVALWFALAAILYFALMFDTAPMFWPPHGGWKVFGAAGAAFFLAIALHVFQDDLRRGDFGGIGRSAVFVALLTVSLYGAGYTKALSDYWGQAASLIGPEREPAVVFLRRYGLCIYRLRDAREPTIADTCTPIDAMPESGRTPYSWTPSPEKTEAD